VLLQTNLANRYTLLMLCAPCCAVLCHAVPCRAVLCRAVLQYHCGHSCYTLDGRLANIESCGVMECDPDCTGLGDADNSSMCKVRGAFRSYRMCDAGPAASASAASCSLEAFKASYALRSMQQQQLRVHA
jgi:hypothetical protein